MEWIVQNARNTDVERQHLNKILAEIKASIVKVEEQARLIVNTSVKDVVGGMLTGEQTGIKVWYDATKGTLNFRVPNFTIRLTGDVTGSGTVSGLSDVNIVTELDESIVGITEAPLDGSAYWRRTGEWEAVPVLIDQLATLEDNGILVATDDGVEVRTIEGVAGNIDVVDGDGVEGNPTIDLPDVGDTGLGDLVGVDIDAKGRVIGIRDVDTDDLEEGVTNLYFTDERAQDAVGTILDDTADIEFVYDDATPDITAVLSAAVHASLASADSAVQSVVAGTNVTVDNTDPQNPIVSATGGGSVVDFLDLGDVPASYTGEAGKVVVVNGTEDGLEFVAPTGTGTVTSVGITGTDGIEVDSGSPVTAAGTIQLGLSATVLGQLADAASAVQPGDLATVATTGDYNDLINLPTLGTMAAEDAADYTPTAGLGTAAFDDTTDFATAAQGLLADSAVQSIVAGTNISVDNTDPQNPIINASGSSAPIFLVDENGDFLVDENGDFLISEYEDYAVITQTITNGDTTHSPSGDAVYDALANKQNDNLLLTSIGDNAGDTTADDLLVSTGFPNMGLITHSANTFPAKASTGGLVPKTITDFGLSLVAAADAAAARTVVGVGSGTYTPTLTNTTNVASSTSNVCQWMRVGDMVHVTGQLSVTATAAAGTATTLKVTLPVASALTANTQGAGAGTVSFFGALSAVPLILNMDASLDRASFLWFSATTSACAITFSFSYQVI